MAQKKKKLHRSFGTQAPADRLFDIFNYLVLGLVAVCVLYPLYFIVIASVSDPVAINNGQVAFWPVGFNTTGYEKIFENTKIWRSYSNTIFYTVVGTTINVILTMMLAYPLSRKNFFARKPLTLIVMFTMYFQGGLIPTYLWMNDLHLSRPEAVGPLVIWRFRVKVIGTENMFEPRSESGHGKTGLGYGCCEGRVQFCRSQLRIVL